MKPHLSITETEEAIKTIKDTFEVRLSTSLNLRRISAPLFLDRQSGLNDHLNGYEKPLTFNHNGNDIEVVQSLAKWKRHVLYEYGFENGEGLYTDMNAIRPSESLDHLHSLYVDQWDWEKAIAKESRTRAFLRETVQSIYRVITSVERTLASLYPALKETLPDTITFIDAETLRATYPSLSPEEREHIITQDKKAVFIERIGGALKDGKPHDLRSPDYDDWQKNGDLLLWHEQNQEAVEISSMGIRVDKKAMQNQLKHFNHWHKGDYHNHIENNTFPQSIGGGIGQSRLCLLLLQKSHIGEVQATYWPPSIRQACKKKGIQLL